MTDDVMRYIRSGDGQVAHRVVGCSSASECLGSRPFGGRHAGPPRRRHQAGWHANSARRRPHRAASSAHPHQGGRRRAQLAIVPQRRLLLAVDGDSVGVRAGAEGDDGRWSPATRGVNRRMYTVATGAQCIPATTLTGAGTPALTMAVSLLMPARAVNVRVTTRVCAQRCAEIVTEPKAAGSRCSTDVRVGSQAASAPTAISIVVLESWTSVTLNSATSMPGSGAGKMAPAPAPGVIVPICLSGVCASSPAQADRGCAGGLKGPLDPDPAGLQRCRRVVERRRQHGQLHRPGSWRRAQLVDQPPDERLRPLPQSAGRSHGRMRGADRNGAA